jgi:hypothetical protein
MERGIMNFGYSRGNLYTTLNCYSCLGTSKVWQMESYLKYKKNNEKALYNHIVCFNVCCMFWLGILWCASANTVLLGYGRLQ